MLAKFKPGDRVTVYRKRHGRTSYVIEEKPGVYVRDLGKANGIVSIERSGKQVEQRFLLTHVAPSALEGK